MVNTHRRTDLGRVSGSLCEALAWLNSPAAIAGEISALERLQALVERCIAEEIDAERWRAVERIEALERQTLASIVRIPWQAGETYNLTPDKEAS